MPPKKELTKEELMAMLSDSVDTINLSSSHSIILNHVKDDNKGKLQGKTFEKVSKQDISSYGLFSANNYHTFYGDITPDKFNPKEEEYIQPVFRLLSEVVIAKYGVYTEFPKEVLKESIPLLAGQTVNCDHSTDIANAVGVVVEAYWQDAYKDETGYIIPGGINGRFKIDGVSNPRIARGINMDPPSIHSNSVTVTFSWDYSHKFSDNPREQMEIFIEKMGTIVDGKLVRRVVTKINSYMETSLVWRGADPFAQKINSEGKLQNPSYAKGMYNIPMSLSAEGSNSLITACDIDFKNLCATESYSEDKNHKTTISNNKNDTTMKKEKDFDSAKFLVELGKFSEIQGTNLDIAKLSEDLDAALVLSSIREELENSTKSLAKAKEDLEKSTAEKEELAKSIEEYKQTLESYKVMVEQGENYIKSLKEQTLENYNKSLEDGAKPNDSIIELINNAKDSKVLLALNDTYKELLEKTYPLSCKECGSHNVDRASYSPKENDSKEGGSSNSIVDNLYNKKFK